MSSETVLQTDDAARYANQLLSDLGQSARVGACAHHPALAWKRSALFDVTGLMLPVPLASHADGVLQALKAISPRSDALPERGSTLLGERARLRKTVRKGRFCAGGYGRLLECADGRIALNLVRTDDWDLIPAWLEDWAEDWDGIERISLKKPRDFLVERGAEIGLAVAKDSLPERPRQWFNIQKFTPNARSETLMDEREISPLIVDLSGLWAGPLASSLLAMTGARVIKVESPTRPDGMRAGHKGFYELLNAGKDCVALNFRNANDLEALKVLLEKADIVIEASRPRALRQLGIEAENFVSKKPGQIWARLTAYGLSENRIGYGDDIGVSAGLSNVMEHAHNEPCFVGDAIADPVNGLHLALILQACLNQGGGAVIDVSMRDVLRFAMGEIPQNPEAVARAWTAISEADHAPFYAMRSPTGSAYDLGAQTAKWVC